MKNTFMKKSNGGSTILAVAVAALVVQTASADWLPTYSYTYTSGTLAGAGGAFETANNSILRDGYYTTQADVTAAAGNPRAYYVNGTSAQRGFIAGGGGYGASPQPGITFDLGQVQQLTNVTIFYADLYGDGVSAPSYVVISVDGGTPFMNTGFDTSINANQYGDARALSIDLTGYTGRYVQMDFYNPKTHGAYGGEWTALNEIMFYGLPSTNSPPIIVQEPTAANLAIYAGKSASFKVLALGTKPLSYQWRTNGSPIPGATGTNYTIASAQASDTASYDVVVANSLGSVASAVVNLKVSLGGVSYTYTSGTLAGPGGDFETTNRSILQDGYYTTQADVNAAAGNPRAYYVNGTSSPRGFIVGPGSAPIGTIPQPGIRFDLGQAQHLTNVNVFYANLNADGISAPSSVVISVDGGTPFTNSDFDTSVNANQYGDARELSIDLTGYTGRFVQMDFIQDTYWTALNEVMFYGSTATNYGEPLVILQNPTPNNLEIYGSQSATFQAAASGTAPLRYQWWKNGVTKVPGATAASLTITNAQVSDTGSYALVVTNSYGSVTSAVATLTVILGTPVITDTTQPAGWTLEQGYSHQLFGPANTAGLPPYSYQWIKDGTPIAGATNTSYAVLHAQSPGNYQVVLANSWGSATSIVATVTVIPTNTVTGVSYTYTSGSLAGPSGGFETTHRSILGDGFATTQADVDAAAGNPWGYYVNGNSSQLGFITGPGSAPVGTIPQPGILFDLGAPQNLTNVTIFYADRYGHGVSAPSSVVISVDGGTPFTNTGFDTSQNVNNYGDARALTIDLTGYIGRYVQVDVYNPENFGYPGGQYTALSEVMFYGSTATNYEVPPVIVQNPTPTGLVVYASQSATFQALASGTEPLSYQWFKGTTPIFGATGTSYTIPKTVVGDTGSYAVVVTNSFGSVTSAVANLTVNLGIPFFTSEPVGCTLDRGYSRVMSGVGVGGLQPIGYQWTKDGTPIAGATNTSYAVLHAQSTAAYRVILTNSFGSAISAVATVIVIPTNTINTAAYIYTSGSLAGPSGTFETTNHSILSDGFATTQEDVDAAAGHPWGYYVNGNCPQLGFIAGGGGSGARPQPGILFDLGASQQLTQVNVFYVDRYGDGVSAPSSVVISVDGGTPFTNSGFDTSKNVSNNGDARELTIALTGYTGRYVHMDFYNPVTQGWPGGEWTALNEVMFYGSTAGNELSFTTSGGQLTLSWTGTGFHAQVNPVVNNAGGWTNVPGGNLSPLIVPIAPTGNMFYRLIKP